MTYQENSRLDEALLMKASHFHSMARRAFELFRSTRLPRHRILCLRLMQKVELLRSATT